MGSRMINSPRGRSCGVSPLTTYMKGFSHLNEMLDVVDFGVPACSDMARRINHPQRLAIKRSEVKGDGSRKRWNCDKVRRDEGSVGGFASTMSPAVPWHIRSFASGVQSRQACGQLVSQSEGPKRRC